MKKKFLTFILIIISILMFIFGFSACESRFSNNDKQEHSCVYMEGICRVCDKNASIGLEYKEFNAGKEYMIVGKGTCKDSNIIIPNNYYGKPITMIDDLVEAEDKITSIVLPNTITRVSEGALLQSNVEKFNIKEGDNLKYLGSAENPYLLLFDTVNDNVTTVNIDANCKIIGPHAITNCNNLNKIEIPDSVITIENNAFEYCENLKNIYIGKSVTYISDSAFHKTENLIYNIKENETIKYLGNEEFPYLYLAGTTRNKVIGTIDENCKFIGTKAFAGVYFDNGKICIPDSLIGICGMAFQNSNLLTIELSENVKYISWRAFYNCENLKGITISNSVTNVGVEAFYNCYSLTRVDYTGSIDDWVQIEFDGYYSNPNGYNSNPLNYANNLYINDDLVTEANITTATKINSYAFYMYDSLTSVVIGDNVQSIGEGAFRNCSSLTSVVIRDNVQSIGEEAFEGCSSLTNITIPNSVTSIGNYAFEYCRSLTSVTIPDSVSSIGDGAFWKCSSLTSIVIGDSVTSIDSITFADCSSLTSIVIPNSVTSIDYGAFYNCRNLQYNVEGNLKYLGNEDNPYLWLVDTTSTSITTGTINNNCRFIGIEAFYKCNSLTSIEISKSVISIGYSAFKDCSKLSSVIFEENSQLTSIGEYAFSGCSSLTSIVIPNSVESIGSWEFYGCAKLASVTFEDTSTWYITNSLSCWQNKTGGTQMSVTNASTNATYLKSGYYSSCYWFKK